MRLEGRVWKRGSGRYWLVEVADLDVCSQGTSKANALSMIKDAIETLVGDEAFRVTVIPGRVSSFTIEASDVKILIALMLKRKRQGQGLTIREVAGRLHFRSPNGYAQYEQGRCLPSLETLDKLLAAIVPEARAVLKIA